MKLSFFKKHKHPKSSSVKYEKKSKIPVRTYCARLEFRCRGRLIYSIHTDEVTKHISIGKAEDCDWIIPSEDRISLDNQAELRLDKREIKLVAAKGAYFYFHGEKQTSVRLKEGSRVAVGDCELFVLPAQKKEQNVSEYHQLEFENSVRDGEMIPIKHSPFTIGSADDNDIVLKSDVVSSHHASIRIAGKGDLWIRDLGSVNGTVVNGSRLTTKERMLMEGDDILIAFCHLRFLDKNVPHTRSHIGKKFLAAIITIMLIGFGFLLFYYQTPHASELLNAADYYTRLANFPAARRMLRQMRDAREFQQFADIVKDRERDLSRYETNFANWELFKNLIAASEFGDAADCSGRLESDKRQAWSWCDADVDERIVKVKKAKDYLALFYRIESLMNSLEVSPETWKTFLANLEKTDFVSPDFGKDEPEWLKPLCTGISDQIGKLKENCANYDKITNMLSTIDLETTDFEKIRNEVNHLSENSPGSLRIWLQDLDDTLKLFCKSIEPFRNAQMALLEMRLDDINRELEFVSSDRCAISSSLMKARNELGKRYDKLLQDADALTYFRRRLSECGFKDDNIKDLVDRFHTEATWESVLKFPSSSIAYPREDRTKPCDDYDRILGITYFYDIIMQSIMNTTNIYSDDLLAEIEFTPECVTVKRLYRRLEELKSWFEIPENSSLLNNRILDLYNHCNSILADRDTMLKNLRKLADANPDNRVGLVALTAYFYLSPEGTITEEELNEIDKRFASLRSRQIELLDNYDILDPVKAQQTRAAILAIGIPGEPVYNRMWDSNQRRKPSSK